MKSSIRNPQSGNTTIIVVVLLVIFAGGVLFLSQRDSSPAFNTADDSATSPTARVQNEAVGSGDVAVVANDSSKAALASAGQYVDYSEKTFSDNDDKTRVYFFHASWCPTCKAADKDLTSNTNKIPENVIVFKTDYDTETELKKKFGLTAQHTFVQVDENGDEVTKWSGGGVDQLAQLIK